VDDVSAILFDLDGTLVGFDDERHNQTMARICIDIGRTYGIDGDRLRIEHWETSVRLWRNASGGGVFRAATGAVDGQSIMVDVWQQALDVCGCQDPAAAKAGFDAYWADRQGVYYLYEETIEVLETLHRRVPIAVVTNGPLDTQLDKLEVTGLQGYFDVVIASGGAGIAKPDPAIFGLALDKLSAAHSRAWHIGDNLHADIGGAIAAGLRAAWVNREAAERGPEHAEPHAEAATLRELLPLLRL
jgi:putative hydrolase of the HAD superfamily